MPDGEQAYRLEPLDTSGVFLGLSGMQCAVLGTGMFLAVLGITSGLPLPVAALPLAGSGALCFARVAERPVLEWLPTGLRWLWTGVTQRRRWAAPLPLWPVDADRPPALPPCLAGLDVIAIQYGKDSSLGAVRDCERHTLTAILPAFGASFAAAPAAEQDRLVAAWGDVLSQFATVHGAVAHVTWSAVTRPSSGIVDHAAWLAGTPGPRSSDAEAEAAYGDLLDLAATATSSHDVVLSVTVSRDRLRGRTRDGDDRDRLGRALASAVDMLRRGLDSAGLPTADPLDSDGLYRLLRGRVAAGVASIGPSGRLAERLGLVPPAASGPLVVESSWRSVHVDAAWHRTWWVAAWPRVAMPAAWLEPFLAADGVVRTMTVAFVPVPAHQSRRRIERDLVKLESDATTKEERGRRVDAGHQRSTDALLEREQELVAGFAEMGYVGLVSVAATTEEELDQHAEVVVQLAHECGMELRPLDGRQDLGWAASLPLGLVPRTLLAT